MHRIRAAVDGERLGLSAVVPVSAVAPAVAADEPRLHLVPGEPGEQPVAVLEPASVRVAAQTLRPEVRRAISDLYESARSDMTFPASWWREDLEAVERLDDLEGVDMGEEPASTPLPVPRLEPSARSGPSLRLIEADAAPPYAERPVPVDESTTVRPFRAVRAPRLRLFGAVGLDHAQGEEPAKSRRSCVEYCAWLLENPGATASGDERRPLRHGQDAPGEPGADCGRGSEPARTESSTCPRRTADASGWRPPSRRTGSS